MKMTDVKTGFDSWRAECQSGAVIYRCHGKMNVKNPRVSNCVSAFSTKIMSFGLCCSAVFVLSSCVETFDFPSADFLKSSNNAEESHWDAGTPPPQAVSADDGVVAPRVVHKHIKSEFLLEEEGVWNLVEQSKSYDPAQAHMEARQKVDTSRRRNDSTLAAHFQPDAKSGKDGKLRVLRLDTGKDTYDIYEDIEVSESAFVKPANMVAGEEQLEKITSVFGAQKPLLEHDVIPPRKPVPEQDARDIADVVRASLDDAFEAVGVGVVRPPPLPIEKRVVSSAPETAPEDAASPKVLIDDAPKPKHKPVISSSSSSSKGQVIQNGHSSGGVPVVNDIRAAVHNGNVRLVIETKNATRYKVAVDHLRNVLRVRLDKAQLNVEPQGSLSSSNPLFGTYVAREKNDGSVLLEVRLKNASQIIDTMILRANISQSHRIVIDMKK